MNIGPGGVVSRVTYGNKQPAWTAACSLNVVWGMFPEHCMLLNHHPALFTNGEKGSRKINCGESPDPRHEPAGHLARATHHHDVDPLVADHAPYLGHLASVVILLTVQRLARHSHTIVCCLLQSHHVVGDTGVRPGRRPSRGPFVRQSLGLAGSAERWADECDRDRRMQHKKLRAKTVRDGCKKLLQVGGPSNTSRPVGVYTRTGGVLACVSSFHLLWR